MNRHEIVNKIIQDSQHQALDAIRDLMLSRILVHDTGDTEAENYNRGLMMALAIVRAYKEDILKLDPDAKLQWNTSSK